MNYRLEPRSGGLAVFPISRQATITTISRNGVTVETKPADAIIPGSSGLSLFTAYWKGGGSWDTDEDCGCQRYETTRTTRQIKAALRKCGFDDTTITNIIAHAKRTA